MAETPPPATPPPLSFAPEAEGSTHSAGQSIDEGRGRIFPCEGCGADLKFHIGQQNLTCPFCGFQKTLTFDENAAVEEQDFRAILARLEELHGRADSEGEQRKAVRCDACGATVEFLGSLTSSECPYCATPIQRKNVHIAPHRISVDGVLPFLVEKDVARRNLAAWVKSRWFAPNDFLQRGVDGKFNGVYLPFWTFDSMTFTRYTGQRGEHYYVTVGTGKNRRRERRTRWYPAAGNFQRFFDDVLVLAAAGLPRSFMDKLEPWPLGKCVPFNPELLAGYLARTYEIGLDQGFLEARQRIDAALHSEVRQRIGGDTQRVHSVDTHFGALTFKHLLLPVWLLAYRYRNKSYQVMVNAATGEVQGERPYSWIKITLAVIAAAVIIATIAFFVTQR